MFGTFTDAFRKPKILVTGCVIAVVLICGMFFVATFLPKGQTNIGTTTTSSNTSNISNGNGSSLTLYPCLKKSSDSVEKIPGMYTKLAVSSQKNLGWGEQYTDNGVRSFNLTGFKDYSKEQTNQIHFSQKRDDGTEYLTYDTSLQVCSESNMTVLGGNIENENVNNIIRGGSDSKSLSSVTEVSWIHAPENTGKYRVDAFIYFEGKWRLVDRMNIEFN